MANKKAKYLRNSLSSFKQSQAQGSTIYDKQNVPQYIKVYNKL